MSESVLCTITDVMAKFWNQFGVAAFVMNYVPKGYKSAYIAYTFSVGSMFERTTEEAVIYTFSESMDSMSIIHDAVCAAIPTEGVMVDLPNGMGKIRLSRIEPFSVSVSHTDNLFKIRKVTYGMTCYANV